MIIIYDKKYFKGKWFRNKYFGIGEDGWKWATHNGLYRLLFPQQCKARFPISHRTYVINPDNIEFDIDDINNFQSPGSYFQAIGHIKIGSGTYIGPNVGLITANHDVMDLSKHAQSKDIYIGNSCWIGMNSVVLPGVRIGDHTVVGAGSVVTKSFEDGYCVIAGNPAKIIKYLESNTDSNI